MPPGTPLFLSAGGATTGNPVERRQDMRAYELYLVIDAEAEEEAVSALIERLTQLIAGDGDASGEVIKVESRGKRRLAYAINKKSEGQDILLTFQAPPTLLPGIERILKLDEQVLRHLLVRIDED
jgi:small subunit ribosomal protein S6